MRGKILERLIDPLSDRDVPREVPIELGGVPSKRCVVNREKCKACITLCVPCCFSFALKVINKLVNVDESRCSGCGLCIEICPHDALSLQSR